MKRPSFQFYPSDWLRDTALRSCSVGARGLWIDMICYMHEGNPYGTLKVGNKVILATNLAAMIGATLADVEGWLNELESSGVFDRDEQGAIYSRRMIRDEIIRNARAAGGKLGGNPSLTKRKVNLKDNHKVEKKVKQKPTPSSSSSTSSSSSKTILTSKNRPSIDDVRAFCKEIGMTEDVGDFCFWKWEGNGWTNGGKPIMNWKATIRSWKAAGHLPPKQKQPGTFGVKKHAGDNDNLDDEPDIMSVLIR